MRKLYEMKSSDLLGAIADTVLEAHPELKKAQAMKLVKNALIYNCVVEEIIGQVEFLLEEGEQ